MLIVSVIFPSSWPKLKIARTYEWKRPQIPSLFYLPMNHSRIATAKVRLRSTESCWAMCLSDQAQGGDVSVNKSLCTDMTHLLYQWRALAAPDLNTVWTWQWLWCHWASQPVTGTKPRNASFFCAWYQDWSHVRSLKQDTVGWAGQLHSTLSIRPDKWQKKWCAFLVS